MSNSTFTFENRVPEENVFVRHPKLTGGLFFVRLLSVKKRAENVIAIAAVPEDLGNKRKHAEDNKI
jgi:hypothetical protein